MTDYIKVKINSKDINSFTAGLQFLGDTLPVYLRAEAAKAGEIVHQIIHDAILYQMPTLAIGEFMIARTKFDVDVSGNTINVIISGMTEGEAGHPRRGEHSSRPGSEVQVSSSEVNLWVLHEFGGEKSNSSSNQTIIKDSGGVVAIRASSNFGSSSPYVGEIRKIVSGLGPQIEKALMAFGAITTNTYIADITKLASGNKIIIDKSARSALSNAGVSMDTLATLGVANVRVNSNGQIVLYGPKGASGAAGKFISGKGQIPTTINR